MFDIAKCEKVTIEQGFLYLGPSNKQQSIGYLELNPKTSLPLHHRPATEKLTQVKGKSVMVIFDSLQGKTVLLDVGNTVTMEPNTWHIHANPFAETSLTYWDFDGNITHIIASIRKKARS